MEEQKESFSYTYSPKQQEEVRKIRDKYLPKEKDKMEQLRRLDQSVTKKGTVAAIIVGTIGALVMGTGMSMAMVMADEFMIPGIIVGVIGMAAVAMAYPLYVHITKKERKRIAPEIMRLSEELMK